MPAPLNEVNCNRVNKQVGKAGKLLAASRTSRVAEFDGPCLPFLFGGGTFLPIAGLIFCPLRIDLSAPLGPRRFAQGLRPGFHLRNLLSLYCSKVGGSTGADIFTQLFP